VRRSRATHQVSRWRIISALVIERDEQSPAREAQKAFSELIRRTRRTLSMSSRLKQFKTRSGGSPPLRAASTPQEVRSSLIGAEGDQAPAKFVSQCCSAF